ncbi:MAG: aminotransferase class III-fold pyridoxal phosphate-dependent enzyme, partial [Candidatus Sericytochromatia bacterium]
GFKTDFPGSIKKYNVEPDLATWGKAIANGFSFCALTGKKEIMELGGIRKKGEEKVFLISTTHGGETSAIAAAIATIDEFLNKPVLKHNHNIGDLFVNKITNIISKNNLSDNITFNSTNWFSSFIFKDKNKNISNGLRTLMMQEMIKRGVLFQGAFVPCYSHNEEDIEYFSKAFEESISIYIKALEDDYNNYLVGEEAKPVFRRYL